LGTLVTGGAAHPQARLIAHLHQLYYSNAKWLDEDLTGFTNGALAPGRSALSSFGMANGTQHVYFVADNQHVHQLYYNNTKWLDEDLTGFTNGALAAAGSALSGFAMANGTPHVYFVASNQHVYQLYYNYKKWLDEDLTGFTNGALAAAGSALSSFAMANGTQHVYFVADNQHVHQVYYNNTKWLDEDLTGFTNGALAAAGSALSSFAMANGTQHVYFVTDNQLHQLYYNNTKWLDADLTGFTNGALAAAGSALSGFAMANGTPHVYFVASNQHVHQLYYNYKKWLDEDLTGFTNGALAAAGSALSSFAMADGTQRVYFVASNQHVHQLYYNNMKWLDEDLTGFTNGALAAAGSALSSFAMANGTQHVFYLN
jgi:cell division protein YceG involved in septum cleavage